MIRGLFLPEEKHKWGCFDYSQQEPRLVVHFAAETSPICFDDSVIKIVEKFKNNTVDFHQTVADMAGISRSQAKTINLGLFYGMGKAKLQAELGLSTKEEAESLFNQYHENVPFVKQLMNQISIFAETNGSIGTLLGRRCRFDKWEIAEWNNGKFTAPMSKPDAEAAYYAKYPEAKTAKIRRALTYKALNKLIQGSAADMTKKAMLDLYEEGIIPHIQIHDELDISVRDEQQAARIVEIMENAVTLAVPNKVDYESGNTGVIYMDKLWHILTQTYLPFIVKFVENIYMILKNIMVKVKNVFFSRLHQYPEEPSFFMRYYPMVRSTIVCLSQRFSKNVFLDPKCRICQLTSYSCGTVLVIILLLLILIF
jgi:DNA polymerase I-like protein with 3'-5' exonuclease and polymerase domains